MSNKYRGEVSIQLDRTRKLYYGFNSAAEYDGVADESLMVFVYKYQQAMMHAIGREADGLDAEKLAVALQRSVDAGGPAAEKFIARISHGKLRLLLWAGLLDEDSEMTPAKAGALMEQATGRNNLEKFLYVAKCVMDAVMLSVGGGASDGAKKKAPAPPAEPVASSA